jgi:hypothetical protein
MGETGWRRTARLPHLFAEIDVGDGDGEEAEADADINEVVHGAAVLIQSASIPAFVAFA